MVEYSYISILGFCRIIVLNLDASFKKSCFALTGESCVPDNIGSDVFSSCPVNSSFVASIIFGRKSSRVEFFNRHHLILEYLHDSQYMNGVDINKINADIVWSNYRI